MGLRDEIKLEKRARNGPYVRLDNHAIYPASKTGVIGGQDVLPSTVDVDRVVARLKERCPLMNVGPSEDAGAVVLSEWMRYFLLGNKNYAGVEMTYSLACNHTVLFHLGE